MAAGNGTRSKSAGSAEWLRKRVDKLFECPAVMCKVEAITELRDGRRCGFDLSRELTTFACMAVSSHQGRPALLNHNWATRTGKTWKSLTEFPSRLEKIAEEIEHINGADPLFWARRRRNDLSRFELQRLGLDCMQLPTIMRKYAEALSERNAAVFAATPRNLRTTGLSELSGLVMFLSGRWHDAKVADLLNATAIALNEERQFDAATIALARHRRKAT